MNYFSKIPRPSDFGVDPKFKDSRFFDNGATLEITLF